MHLMSKLSEFILGILYLMEQLRSSDCIHAPECFILLDDLAPNP